MSSNLIVSPFIPICKLHTAPQVVAIGILRSDVLESIEYSFHFCLYHFQIPSWILQNIKGIVTPSFIGHCCALPSS